MKTWQMVKELTENPEKEFKSGKYSAFVDDGLFEIWFDGKLTELAISVDREWEEVKEPVTFMEAVESQKLVKVEHSEISDNDFLPLKGYLPLDVLLYHLGDRFPPKAVRTIIMEGDWYIK